MSTPQILVVEDEGITAMDLEARLKRLGYSVPAVVSSGEEAILRAEETHPDLVLMDIVLRGQTDGVQAAKELQSRLGIPVVYLTAYFDDRTLERAKATEPFGYIIKPFQDINLRTSIEIALSRRAAEKKPLNRERWLAHLADATGTAAVTFDGHGLVTFMNSVARELTGWEQHDAFGTHVAEVFTVEDKETAFSNIAESLERSVEAGLTYNAWLVARHGVESPVQYSVTPLTDKEGNNAGAVLFFEAIDAVQVGESQRAEPLGVSESLIPNRPLCLVEKAPEERMSLLETLVQNSPLATVVLDPQQRILLCNPAFEDLFLYQRQGIMGNKLGDLIEDEVTGTDTIEVSPSLLSGRVLHATGRRRRSNGILVDVQIYGVPVFVNGKLEGVYVVYQDITERRRAEEALQHANVVLKGWFRALEKRSEETTLLNEMVDLLQTCVSAEEAYAVIARSAQQLFPSEAGALCVLNASQNLVEAVAIWGQPLVGERVFTPEDCWALRRGQVHLVEDPGLGLVCRHLGALRGVSYLCVPMMGQGEALGVLHVHSGTVSGEGDNRLTDAQQRLAVTAARHIALALANLRLRETLRMQSIRDPLTGLFNRRYMEESLVRELRRAARNQPPLGAIMLDLDKFKVFNDTYGHEAGDTLLRELGGFLRSRTRGEDIACRYGGEEFVLILPDASMEVTQQRAERLREEFKRLNVQQRGRSLGPVTLSVGVAVFPEHGSTVEEILRAADHALYQAKAEGRDRVALGAAAGEHAPPQRAGRRRGACWPSALFGGPLGSIGKRLAVERGRLAPSPEQESTQRGSAPGRFGGECLLGIGQGPLDFLARLANLIARGAVRLELQERVQIPQQRGVVALSNVDVGQQQME